MYYLFSNPVFPTRWIGDSPYIEGVSFWQGRLLDNVPEPIEYTLEPHLEGTDGYGPDLPPYFLEHYLLFRDDLIETMRNAGVDNFQIFKALIHDPDNGQTYEHYRAVNIIGLVSAADMQKSEATMPADGIPLIDVDFDSLVIDENRAHGIKMFRLAESTNAVLLHHTLVEALAQAGFAKYGADEYRAEVPTNPSMNLTLEDIKECAV